jgi:hypothetical protein
MTCSESSEDAPGMAARERSSVPFVPPRRRRRRQDGQRRAEDPSRTEQTAAADNDDPPTRATSLDNYLRIGNPLTTAPVRVLAPA